MSDAVLCASPGVLGSKNFGINRVNYWMINRKNNCEHEVSCQKLTAHVQN